ncbi:sensor histidine kinase [Actinomadura sp. 7K507]|uniref:sensor histidine kinase n=1 Tax=Actinomadura sp. 7K507 TaxID=2530365 RepID=UPI001FB6F59B|nr:sensor histidine kinase [Actinomadura sp. 7K507]
MTGPVGGPRPEPPGRPDAYGDDPAAVRERSRLALELHDTVAHHMSLTLVRAEGALRTVPDLPDAARQALEAVRDGARAALTDTRRIVGLLRGGDEGAGQPGLDRLGELVGAAGGAGLMVSSAVAGTPRPLPGTVDLASFRIVQESLSNAIRYAPGAHVTVEIRYGPGALRLSIADDGARTVPKASPGGGHGLAGMRERARVLGGTVQAGPRAGSGWSVVAELPWEEHVPGCGRPARGEGRATVPRRPDGRRHPAGHRAAGPGSGRAVVRGGGG